MDDLDAVKWAQRWKQAAKRNRRGWRDAFTALLRSQSRARAARNAARAELERVRAERDALRAEIERRRTSQHEVCDG